ncbi:MAG: type 4a pilus biogenesis protein PilO [Verrucomicrobiota bacterium]|nr:type 4a pilus biogenesis protein PilO [Limisphaera sp.]MDW8381616.1 type 4a pilus biogenesis protein PilO [Verrucomicrobiota bacterium]
MKLSKEKQKQLWVIALVTLIVLLGVWLALLRPLRSTLEQVRREIAQIRSQIAQAEEVLRRSDEVLEKLQAARSLLEQCEEQMVSGDYYAQIISRIRQLRAEHAVEIPQFSTISGPSSVELLPSFPYQEVSMTISGKGYYHDIGTFVADFENRHPYWRLQNLEIEPQSGTERDGSAERLSFRVTVVSLVRSGG